MDKQDNRTPGENLPSGDIPPLPTREVGKPSEKELEVGQSTRNGQRPPPDRPQRIQKGRAGNIRIEWTNIGIVLIMLIQAIIYWFTFQEVKNTATATRNAVEVANQSMRFGNAAYVSVQGLNLTKFAVGEKTEAIITYVNAGNTPAYNVKTYGHIGLRDKPLPPDMPGAKDIKGEEPSEDILGPNGDVTDQSIGSGMPLTDHLKSMIDEKGYRIYVWGIVTYDDIFKRHRWTKFCYVQYSKTMALEACTNNNEADDQS